LVGQHCLFNDHLCSDIMPKCLSVEKSVFPNKN